MVHFVATSVIPDVWVQTALSSDVIPRAATETFTQFQPAAQHQIVVDFIDRRTVIRINVPAVITAPAAITDRGRVHSVQKWQRGVFVDHTLRL